MGKIFVNYRRDDSKADARQIVRQLQTSFGKEQVFFDVKSLAKGERFDLAIDGAVSKCDAMVIVIGESWLSLTKPDGTKRIFADDDFVRYEIERGLHHNKPILPVLIDSTAMPGPDDLPPSIRELSLWNSARVEHETFDRDCVALVKQLGLMTETKGVKPWWIAAAASAALAVGLGAGYGLNQSLVANGLQAALEERTVQLDLAVSDLNERAGALTQAQAALATLRQEADVLRKAAKDLDTMSIALGKTRETLAGKQALLAEKAKELAIKDADIQSKSEIIGHKQARIDQLDDMIVALEDDIAKHDAQTKKTAETVLARHGALKAEISGLTAKVATLEEAGGSLAGRLSGLTQERDALLADLAALRKQQARLTTERDDLDLALKSQTKNFSDATAKIAELDQALASARTQNAALKASGKALAEENQAMKDKPAAALAEIKDLKARVRAACAERSWFADSLKICEDI